MPLPPPLPATAHPPDWSTVLQAARHGNPPAPWRLVLDEAAWRRHLAPEVFAILRGQGTERPFSSALCALFELGRYACAGCGTALFDAAAKFDSGSGWPSFSAPLSAGLVAYHADDRHGMQRIETRCAICDGHLGHVFPDGPPPTGLRYCINALALSRLATEERALLAGGCFWGMQELLRHLPGVQRSRVGYTGGTLPNATYRQHEGHAEAVELWFDPARLSYRELLEYFFRIHDPSTPDRQGNDRGPSYRSGLYPVDARQQRIAQATIAHIDASGRWPGKVLTEVKPAGTFWEAEPEHQDYLQRHPGGYTCHWERPEWVLPAP